MGKKNSSPAAARAVNPAEDFLDPMESLIDERDEAGTEAVVSNSEAVVSNSETVASTSEATSPLAISADAFPTLDNLQRLNNNSPVDLTRAKPPEPLRRNMTVDPPRLKPLDTTLVCEWDFALPVYAGPLDESKIDMGYVPTRVDCDLTGPLGQMFKRLLLGCRNLHLTYRMNGRETHVETGADLVRYLVSRASDDLERFQPEGGK